MNALLTLTITCALTSMNAHAGIIYSGPINQSVNRSETSQVTIAGETFELGVRSWIDSSSGQTLFSYSYVSPSPTSSQAYLQTYRPSGDFALLQWAPDYWADIPVRFLENETVSNPAANATWLGSSDVRRVYSQNGSSSTLIAFCQIHGIPFAPQGYHGDWDTDGGYVAFAIGSGADRKFGWMHLTNMTAETLTLSSWAYNDVAGASIMAGDTGATAVPGAGGLVALACGAAGLRRRRRKPPSTTSETA